MASTALADILSRSPVSSYVTAALPDHIEFVRSGAAVMDHDDLASLGGDFIKVRHFAEDTVAAEVNDGTSASTPGNVSSWQDIGVVCHRKRVRGVDDVIKAALGRGDENAVNNEILSQNTYYWAKRMQTSMVKVLTGIFDSSSGVIRTTHRNAIGVSTGAPVPASFGALVDTAVKLGDNMQDFALMITPSKVWANLVKENAAKVTYTPIGGGKDQLTYNGMAVYLDDQFGTTGSDPFKLYHTFLVRPGAMFFAMQRTMGIGTQYEAVYPRELITTTLDYVAHVRGVKWGVATTNPADSALATATNWTKVATNDKEIGVVALVSNAT